MSCWGSNHCVMGGNDFRQSPFRNPPQSVVPLVTMAPIYTVGHIESQAPTNLVDRILQDKAEVSETIIKAFIQPLSDDVARNCFQQHAKLLARRVAVTESALARKRDLLVDALAGDLLPFSVP